MSEKKPPRIIKLTITSSTIAYAGKNTRSEDYTIYEVKATKEDGTPVNEKLRSFEDLPIGETLELAVVKFDSEKYGTSYTLSRRGSRGPGTTRRMTDLEERVQELVNKVAELGGRIAQLEGAAAKPATAPPPASESLDGRFGTDPPF